MAQKAKLRLLGNVAVVTGAASGLGRALAHALAAEGCHLALGDVDRTGLENTRRAVEANGISTSIHTVNMADRDSVSTFAEKVMETHGRAGLLINNAGVDVFETIADLSYEDMEWITQTNYWGVVNGTKTFLPYFLRQDSGVVVNMSSLLGLIGVPMQGAYCASKFAIRGFTETLQLELAATGVRAICVHPGGVKTDLMANSRFYKDYDGSDSKQEALQRFDQLTPLSADRAANIIVKGIKKGKSRIIVGPDARLFDLLQRLFPSRYPGILLWMHKLRTKAESMSR